MEEINCSTRETQECSAQLHEKEEEEVKLKAIRGEHEDDIWISPSFYSPCRRCTSSLPLQSTARPAEDSKNKWDKVTKSDSVTVAQKQEVPRLQSILTSRLTVMLHFKPFFPRNLPPVHHKWKQSWRLHCVNLYISEEWEVCEEFLFSLISVVSLKKYELTVSISLSKLFWQRMNNFVQIFQTPEIDFTFLSSIFDS